MLSRLKQWFSRPTPPPWEKPRYVGQMRQSTLFHELHERLEQVTEVWEETIYYRDRFTGQLWVEQLEEDPPAPHYCLSPVTEIPAEAPRVKR